MQEVVESLVKSVGDAYDDAIRHTDVVELLKYIKVQRELAEKQMVYLEKILNKTGVHDPDEDMQNEIEVCEMARVVETFDYFIDLIESGKFAKERMHEF